VCDAFLQNEKKCHEKGLHFIIGKLSLCDRHWYEAVSFFNDYIQGQKEFAAWADREKLLNDHVIYYVQRKDKLIKIGFSKNVHERLKVLSRDHGDLILLCSHRGHMNQERGIHSMFNKYHACGEWFYPHKRLLKHIYKVQTGYIPKHFE